MSKWEKKNQWVRWFKTIKRPLPRIYHKINPESVQISQVSLAVWGYKTQRLRAVFLQQWRRRGHLFQLLIIPRRSNRGKSRLISRIFLVDQKYFPWYIYSCHRLDVVYSQQSAQTSATLDKHHLTLTPILIHTTHSTTMGLFDMISSALGFTRKEARILVIGLDNSGKTTLIHHIKPKKVSNPQPVVPLSLFRYFLNVAHFQSCITGKHFWSHSNCWFSSRRVCKE